MLGLAKNNVRLLKLVQVKFTIPRCHHNMKNILEMLIQSNQPFMMGKRSL